MAPRRHPKGVAAKVCPLPAASCSSIQGCLCRSRRASTSMTASFMRAAPRLGSVLSASQYQLPGCSTLLQLPPRGPALPWIAQSCASILHVRYKETVLPSTRSMDLQQIQSRHLQHGTNAPCGSGLTKKCRRKSSALASAEPLLLLLLVWKMTSLSCSLLSLRSKQQSQDNSDSCRGKFAQLWAETMTKLRVAQHIRWAIIRQNAAIVDRAARCHSHECEVLVPGCYTSLLCNELGCVMLATKRDLQSNTLGRRDQIPLQMPGCHGSDCRETKIRSSTPRQRRTLRYRYLFVDPSAGGSSGSVSASA